MSSERARESRWTAAWCAVALAFPWSNAFMSVAAGCLGLVAILDLVKPVRRTAATGDARTSGLALAGLVLLSGLSSLWSEDAALAWNDVRIKLPLLVGGLVLLAARGAPFFLKGRSAGSSTVRRSARPWPLRPSSCSTWPMERRLVAVLRRSSFPTSGWASGGRFCCRGPCGGCRGRWRGCSWAWRL